MSGCGSFGGEGGFGGHPGGGGGGGVGGFGDGGGEVWEICAGIRWCFIRATSVLADVPAGSGRSASVRPWTENQPTLLEAGVVQV